MSRRRRSYALPAIVAAVGGPRILPRPRAPLHLYTFDSGYQDEGTAAGAENAPISVVGPGVTRVASPILVSGSAYRRVPDATTVSDDGRPTLPTDAHDPGMLSTAWGGWFRFTDSTYFAATNQVLWECNWVPASPRWLMAMNSGGRFAALVDDGVTSVAVTTAPGGVAVDETTHLFAVHNRVSEVLTIYVDGVAVASSSTAGMGAIAGITAPQTFGYRWPGFFPLTNEMKGYADELCRYWGSPLSAADVRRIYDWGAAGLSLVDVV